MTETKATLHNARDGERYSGGVSNYRDSGWWGWTTADRVVGARCEMVGRKGRAREGRSAKNA